jgi:hypothetical protein
MSKLDKDLKNNTQSDANNVTKTALTQLIEKWESEMGSYIPNIPIYRAFIEDARNFLEKEEQQIAYSYENGAFDFQGTSKEVTNGDGFDYFKKNYCNCASQ